MAGRRRSRFVPLVGPLRPSTEHTSADQILSSREDGVLLHRLSTARPNRPRAQRFTTTNHIGPLLSGSDSTQARSYNRPSADRVSPDYHLTGMSSQRNTSDRVHTSGRTSPEQNMAPDRSTSGPNSSRTSPGYTPVGASLGHISGRASTAYTSDRSPPGYTAGRASPEHTSGRASPEHTSGRASPGHTSGRASSGYTSGRASPGRTSGRASSGHTSGRATPRHTSGRASLGYTAGRASPGYNPGRASPGYTSFRALPAYSSGRTSPGYTSGRASAGYTSGRASPGYTLGRALPGYTSGSSVLDYDSDRPLAWSTSGRTSPGYRSDRSSTMSVVSHTSTNRQPAESISQQLHPDREWSFTDMDIHAIVDRDFRFITVTPSTSEDGINSDLSTYRRRHVWSEDEKQYVIQAMGRALAIKAMEDAEEEIVAMARKCPYSMGADLTSTAVSAHQPRNKKRSKLFEKFQDRFSQVTSLEDQTDNISCLSLSSHDRSEYGGSSLTADYNTHLSKAHTAAWLSEEFDAAEGETTQDQTHQVDFDIFTTRSIESQDERNGYGYSDEMNKEYRRRGLRYISDPSMSSSSEMSDATRWESGASVPDRQRQRAEQSSHRKHGHTSSRSFRLFSDPQRTKGSERRSSGKVIVDFSRQYLQDHASLTLGQLLRHTNRSRLPSASDNTSRRYNVTDSPNHRTSHHENAFQTRDSREANIDRHRRVTDHVLADNVPSRPHDPGIFRGHSTHRVTDYFDCRPPRSMQGRLPSSFCPHDSSRRRDRRLGEIYRQTHPGLVEQKGSEPMHSTHGVRKYHEKGSLVLELSPPKRT